MTIILYHFPPSAPSRCALMVAKALNLDLDVQILDLFKKEQLKPEFIEVRNTEHLCDYSELRNSNLSYCRSIINIQYLL